MGLALFASGAANPADAQSKDDLFKQVFGKKKADVERRIEAELEVDTFAREAVPITIAGARLLEVDLVVLGERLADLLDDSSASCLTTADMARSVAAAGACGISLRYDPASLKLEAQVPAEHRREQNIAVRTVRQLRNPTTTEAQLSGYLNLSASARRQQGGPAILSSKALGLDGALRWRGSTLEFDGLCGTGGCIPGLRSLVVDQTLALRRWRFGDLPDASADSLVIPQLRGISVGTAFELAPEQSYTPDLDSPLELNTPATVEVLVNNRQVQRLQLPAGRYSIRDFPLAFGANAVELRITDAAGRQEIRHLQAFVDLSLLDAGLSRYGVAVGQPIVAIDDAGELTQPLLLAANYARGLGPRTTLKAAVASIPALNRHAAELGLTRALGGWLIGTDLACSAGASQGCSANLRFRRAEAPGEARLGWRLEGALGARQAEYADVIGFGAGNDSASVLLRAARSLSEHYSLALGLRGVWNELDGASGVLSAQIGGRLGRRLSFRVGVERGAGSELERDTRVVASVSLLFDRARQSLRVDAESVDALQAARWQLNRGGMHGGYNATLGATRSDLGSTSDAAASYRNERFGADVSLARSQPPGGYSADETRVTLRSGIVYADGHFGLTERVLGGFGIVVPVDSAAAGAVFVNPVDDDYLASSLGPGPAVIPALRAYEARPLVLTLPDLAANHDPGELFPVVKPGYKGGVLIHAGGAASVGLQVHILNADDSPAEMISGHLVPDAGGAALPVFAGRGGRLRASGLTAGRWTLVLDVRPARQHALTIPSDAQGVIDLGDLKP
jgi:outer membrane usher protein